MTAQPIGRPAATLLRALALHPRALPTALRLDRLRPALWLVLIAAALWPHGVWMARRMTDGSDDPLGALALAALAALLWVQQRALRQTPRPGWFAAALAGVAAATAAQGTLPPLAAALLGLLAFAAGALAFLPASVARAPVLGLGALALPLLASLQFYAGYPLRVLTAELSRWLLQSGHAVERSGAALEVDGQLVLVDAACSGVQMVWLGYFSACAVALAAGRHDRAFLARLPLVGVLVLGGNVLRNTVLVAAQAGGWPLPGWAHDGVGLVVLAAVCGAICWAMHRPETIKTNRIIKNDSCQRTLPKRWNTFEHRSALKLCAALLLPACVLWSALQALQPARAGGLPHTAGAELPRRWNPDTLAIGAPGAALRPLALGAVEQRFALGFPGQIARLTDGHAQLVWRQLHQPTRMLHPATDCYRAAGWRTSGEQLERRVGVDNDNSNNKAALWRCFTAARGGQRLRVCERIEDAAGQGYTDASAWYWAALAGQSTGPWQAVTVARPL